ncbi:hypothetical protein EDC01DRAFT_658006 [Geopyxis carbonaria]|nr:hypothetical protein EDC01DRAFT_658006 [Geopyxis carbonaria]
MSASVEKKAVQIFRSMGIVPGNKDQLTGFRVAEDSENQSTKASYVCLRIFMPIVIARGLSKASDACSPVIRALTDSLRSRGSKLIFNDSTGLQIRIGFGRSWTLTEVRRLAKAIIVFEDQISLMRSIRRQGSAFQLHNAYNRDQGEKKTRSELIQWVDDHTEVERLVENLNLGEKHSWYDFSKIIRLRTVGFQQPRGTHEHAEIMFWVGFYLKFVRAALLTADFQYGEWACRGLESNKYSVYKRFGLDTVPPKEYPKRLNLKNLLGKFIDV